MPDTGAGSPDVEREATSLVALCREVPELHRVISILDLAGLAHEEIEHAQKQHPEHHDALARSFQALMPGSLVVLDPRVYRQHVRELIDRVLDGLDLAPGTDAEILACLTQASLVAPPGQQAAALHERLFARVLPEQYGRIFADPHERPTSEPWPGACAELANQLRRRLAKRERRIAPDEPRGTVSPARPGRTRATRGRRNTSP